jgi:type VI secretion system secreted protein Hcp
MATDMFIKIG